MHRVGRVWFARLKNWRTGGYVLVAAGIELGQLREEPSGWSNWNGFHAYNCLMAPACLGIITHGKRKAGASPIMAHRYCNSLGRELLEIKLLVLRVYC